MTNQEPSLQPRPSPNTFVADFEDTQARRAAKSPHDDEKGVDPDDAQIPEDQDGELSDDDQATDDDDIVGADGERG